MGFAFGLHRAGIRARLEVRDTAAMALRTRARLGAEAEAGERRFSRDHDAAPGVRGAWAEWAAHESCFHYSTLSFVRWMKARSR